MEASQENIKGLVIKGFKETKKGVYIFKDIKAYETGGYLFLKYGKESLPIIDSLEFVGLMQRGIYSFTYLDKETSEETGQFFNDDRVKTLEEGIEHLPKNQEKRYSEEEALEFFIEGYKQRAESSNLIFDDASRIYAVALFEQFKNR